MADDVRPGDGRPERPEPEPGQPGREREPEREREPDAGAVPAAPARRGPGRRALLLGGAAVGVGAAGVAAWDELSRWWWRVPGNDKPRTPGAVDYRGAEWVAAASANWRRGDRPDDYTVDRVIIHVVQGSYAVALKVFRDPGHGAATHYVVRGGDGHVAQCVRELDVAFHAGNRAYNERSVGIEHEGFVDRPRDFTDVMYASSARLTADICARHDIPLDREHIIGHHEVPGADHTDPGRHWDWDRYLRLVRAAAKEAAEAGARGSGRPGESGGPSASAEPSGG